MQVVVARTEWVKNIMEGTNRNKNVHHIRYEDLLLDAETTLGDLSRKAGLNCDSLEGRAPFDPGPSGNVKYGKVRKGTKDPPNKFKYAQELYVPYHWSSLTGC
jgi:hypothetical protein